MLEDLHNQNKLAKYEKKWSQVVKNKDSYLKDQINRIKTKEQKRMESLQKHEDKEKAVQRKLNSEHKKIIERMRLKEE